MKGITVIDVFREMGMETDKKKTWAVGQMMQKHYAKKHGCQPPKDNRTKTCGVGVHCFAIYPPQYRRKIRSLVVKVGAEENRQQVMRF